MSFLFFNTLNFAVLLGFFTISSSSLEVKRNFSLSGINPATQGVGLESKVVATNLDVPWEMLWGPDNKLWITEQKGSVSRIDPQTGVKTTLLQLTDVWYFRTAGLLGMTLHPDMKNSPYVFLNYTFLKGEKPFSRLIRFTWQGDTLINPKILMEIAANNGHSGSRLAFSKGKLFWATGDAASTTFAQDFTSPNGKILRLNIDGTVPNDNPVMGSPVWAMGFRNIQGMVFSKKGKLYTSEHGDATDDEVNLIEKTKNYGWPVIQGFANDTKELEFQKAKATVDPLKAWTPTIAPAGMDYYSSMSVPQWSNSLLLVSLKGKRLISLKLNEDGSKVISEEIFLENQFGRLRDICISPSGDVYVSTSNRDWNKTMGDPLSADDRIIKISPSDKPNVFSSIEKLVDSSEPNASSELYMQYCASCHQQTGLGLSGVFPPLKGSALVAQGEMALLKKILTGSSGPATIAGITYDAQMPSFSFLKDQEIVEIANYVRAMQVEKYPGISLQSVSTARVN